MTFFSQMSLTWTTYACTKIDKLLDEKYEHLTIGVILKIIIVGN